MTYVIKFSPNIQSDILEKCRILKLNYTDVFSFLDKATEAEIKESYLKLSRKIHPDKNSNPGATKELQVLKDANEELQKLISNFKPQHDNLWEEFWVEFEQCSWKQIWEFQHAQENDAISLNEFLQSFDS